ncbi:MAG TPA: DUF2127 domain-containing protein [Verrucomicrobiae bacterium]|nr:DUF2127 domain-containing protein [Verrucomicrobiae bacterium]
MTVKTSLSAAPKKRAPTLYFIVAVKLIKGVALVLLALGIFTLANRNLPDLFRNFLEWVHLDPERSFFAAIASWLETITPANVRILASGTFLCGVYLIALGLGLALRAKWAIWLAIGESAFFIPIEVWELLRRHPLRPADRPHPEFFPHPKLGLLIVLALNVLIVWYLFENRHRLFRHHHS